jgi:hypothetical protein
MLFTRQCNSLSVCKKYSSAINLCKFWDGHFIFGYHRCVTFWDEHFIFGYHRCVTSRFLSGCRIPLVNFYCSERINIRFLDTNVHCFPVFPNIGKVSMLAVRRSSCFRHILLSCQAFLGLLAG